MNLNHLKYFFDAAALESLSSAANRNHVSQSAISQAIVSLESHLGCKLIFHKRNRFQLTDAGDVAFRECKDVFDSLDQLKSRVSEQEFGVGGELKFACINSVAGSLIPEVLRVFQEKYPDVRVKLRLGNSEVVQKWLLEKEIEFGLVVDEAVSKQLSAKTIKSGSYRLFGPPQGGQSISKIGAIVTRAERPEVQDLLKHWKRSQGQDLKIQMEVTSWEIIKGFVLSGVGIGLCPDYVIEKELKERKLRLIKSPGWEYKYQINALFLKGRELSKSARLLIDGMG